MNFISLSDRFNLSSFNKPLFSFITIIAYLNMVFLQLNNAVAMDFKDIRINNSGHKIKEVFIQDPNKDKAILETQKISRFSPRVGYTQNWVDKGKFVASSFANTLRSAFKISPNEAQFLSYFTHVSHSIVSMNPDFTEPLLLLWGSYIAAKIASPGLVFARQFVKKQYQSWFGNSAAEQKNSKLKSNSIQLNTETAETILKTLAITGIIAKPVAAISATNLNQNLNYTTNGPPAFFQPIKISDAHNNFCQVYFSLADLNAGVLYSNGTSTITPIFNQGQWIVAGKCAEEVQPLVLWLAYYPAKDYSMSPVTIFDSIADGLGYVSGQIRIFRIILPPTNAPTTAPTNSPTLTPTVLPTLAPTALPTAAPTVSPTLVPTTYPTAATLSPTLVPTASPVTMPTLSPTLTPTTSPVTTPTLSPTLTPTASPVTTPTLSPTLTPTASPVTKPTLSPALIPTTSPVTTPTLSPTLIPTISPPLNATMSPTSLDPSFYGPKNAIISAVIAGALLMVFCCIYCIWGKKDKKKEYKEIKERETEEETLELNNIKNSTKQFIK